MKFNEVLNQYISRIDCTSQALAEITKLAPSVISRYRSGSREPSEDSKQLVILAEGLELLAGQKGIAILREDILRDFTAALLNREMNTDRIVQSVNEIFDLMRVN